jgi:Ca2+-binding EF-hand superfamily protein
VAPECPEDVTGDGQIDVLDLNAVLAAFNQPASADPDADITDDGQIDVLDLNAVLAAFNTACP